MEAGPPLTCMYCGDAIPVAVELVMVTKTSVNESGEPDFTTQTVEGVAHPACWEGEQPDAAEAD